jgi:hypothetical protein
MSHGSLRNLSFDMFSTVKMLDVRFHYARWTFLAQLSCSASQTGPIMNDADKP